MKKTLLTSLLIGLSLTLTSCASSIATTVQRPAELDLRGANTISVLPFQTSSFGEDSNGINILGLIKITFGDNKINPKKEVTDYLTNRLTDELLNSDYLTVVGSRKVEAAIDSGSRIPCDVYLTGYLSKWDDEITSEYDEDDDITYYRRHISGTVVYEIIDSKTNQVIGRKYRDFSGSSSRYKYRRELPDTISIVDSSIDYIIKNILKELQPYEITKYISLLDDKEKSDEMKTAKKLAKDGYINEAQEKYEAYYELTGIYEAGYNAAILLEVLQDYDGAEKLMNKVYLKTGEKKAFKALKDIQLERSYSQVLQEQMDKKHN